MTTEVAIAKELDLRLLGKVIIFRYRQTDRTFLLYIDVNYYYDFLLIFPPHQKTNSGGPTLSRSSHVRVT